MHRYLLLLMTVVGMSLLAQPAAARPPFKKAFEEKYGKAPGKLQDAIKTAGCNVCHIPEKPKEQRNSYGEVLRDELGKQGWDGMNIPAGLKDPVKSAEILKALGKALQTAEQVKNDDGKPYGEQIKAGDLPK